MARTRRLLYALLLLLAWQAPCQDVAGKRVDLSFDMAGARASLLGMRAGIDIARFLGLGVLWSLGFADPGILDLGAGVWCTAALLSEGELGLPVTLVIRGAFSKVRSLGDSLDEQSLTRSGTQGTIGAELSKTFTVSPRLGLLTALEVDYAYSTTTTEAMAGSDSTFQTLIVPEAQILYGLRLGLQVSVAEHLKLLFALHADLDGDFAIHYGPSASLISR